MDFKIDRRSVLKAGAALAAACALPARAQAKSTLRFAAVFSDKDIRAGMIQMFAKEVEGDGGGMMVWQAVGAFEHFTGIRPDAARMETHFLRMVARNWT